VPYIGLLILCLGQGRASSDGAPSSPRVRQSDGGVRVIPVPDDQPPSAGNSELAAIVPFRACSTNDQCTLIPMALWLPSDGCQFVAVNKKFKAEARKALDAQFPEPRPKEIIDGYCLAPVLGSACVESMCTEERKKAQEHSLKKQVPSH